MRDRAIIYVSANLPPDLVWDFVDQERKEIPQGTLIIIAKMNQDMEIISYEIDRQTDPDGYRRVIACGIQSLSEGRL